MQPVSGLQSSVVQSSPSLQSMAVPAHCPATHRSWVVHASPSSHTLPSALVGFEQPVDGSQMPALWHWSDGTQVITVPHVPATQPLPTVHALPSSHAVPSVAGSL